MRGKKKGGTKLVIAGLGLAFLGFVAASAGKEYSFVAGAIFVGIVILGVIGLIKMRGRTNA